MGRTNKAFQYWMSDEGLLRIEGWAKDGLTEPQIAECMEVSYSSFKRWKVDPRCDLFRAVLKNSKEVIDRKVENALLKRALGYDYEEVTKEQVPIYDPETGIIIDYEMKITKKVTKHMPPDATSMIYWLKNRKYMVWRDKHEIENKDAIERLDKILAKVEDAVYSETEGIHKECE